MKRKIAIALVSLMTILAPDIVKAQSDAEKQLIQAGVYTVNFKSQGVNLAGLLFTPQDFDQTKKYPTVVFSGPFNQIKEQMGAKYGKKAIYFSPLIT